MDFKSVAQRIDEEIKELVESEAQSLLEEKYENLIGEIYDIQERIKNQKEKLFQYDWENN